MIVDPRLREDDEYGARMTIHMTLFFFKNAGLFC